MHFLGTEDRHRVFTVADLRAALANLADDIPITAGGVLRADRSVSVGLYRKTNNQPAYLGILFDDEEAADA